MSHLSRGGRKLTVKKFGKGGITSLVPTPHTVLKSSNSGKGSLPSLNHNIMYVDTLQSPNQYICRMHFSGYMHACMTNVLWEAYSESLLPFSCIHTVHKSNLCPNGSRESLVVCSLFCV